VRALLHTGAAYGVPLHVTSGVERANARQKGVVLEKLRDVLGDLAGARVAVWGLAFKPQTDDLRESPAMLLIDQLSTRAPRSGARPGAARGQALLAGRLRDGAASAWRSPRRATRRSPGRDALAGMTDWNEYRNPDFAGCARRSRGPRWSTRATLRPGPHARRLRLPLPVDRARGRGARRARPPAPPCGVA
jgi:UDPglucose 6-dehydrogenase